MKKQAYLYRKKYTNRTLIVVASIVALTIISFAVTKMANGSGIKYGSFAVSAVVLAPYQQTPNYLGVATTSALVSQIVIDNSLQAVMIMVSNKTINPTVNINSFITEGSGAIPQISINSILANIFIPATTIMSTDKTWNGITKTPHILKVALPVTPGEIKTIITAIEIGSSNTKLSFDKAVQIVFANQKENRVGYIGNDNIFIEIKKVCKYNDGEKLNIDEDCKIVIGNDLVIWTRHFTKFITFTSTPTKTYSPIPPLNPQLEIEKTFLNISSNSEITAKTSIIEILPKEVRLMYRVIIKLIYGGNIKDEFK